MTRTAPKLESLSARNQQRPRCAHRSSARSGGIDRGSRRAGSGCRRRCERGKAGEGGITPATATTATPHPPNLREDRYYLLETKDLLIGAHARPLSLANRTHD